MTVVSHTDIYGNSSNWNSEIDSYENTNGNFSIDPNFCEYAGEPYHLLKPSPCQPNGSRPACDIPACTCDSELIGARSAVKTCSQQGKQAHETSEGMITTEDQSSSVNETANLKDEFTGISQSPYGITNIQFSTASKQAVNLAIFDLNGRQVRRLINDHIAPGNHAVTWDGKDDNGANVNKGVYFCKIVTDTFQQSGRCFVIQ